MRIQFYIFGQDLDIIIVPVICKAPQKKILSDFGGKLPASILELETLPGIGPSTAGAISAIAFGKQAPILDGNVKRVLTRLHGLMEVNDKHLWSLAEQYTPQQRPGDYTQAIMDLGATLCTRGKPRCADCPFKKILHRSPARNREYYSTNKSAQKTTYSTSDIAHFPNRNGCNTLRKTSCHWYMGRVMEFTRNSWQSIYGRNTSHLPKTA